MKTFTIYISGMHCVSCETLLEDEFKSVLGVLKVQVDRRKNVAHISYETNKPDFLELQRIGKKFGYEVLDKAPPANQPRKTNLHWPDWIMALGIVAIFYLAYNSLNQLGFLDIMVANTENISYGVALLVGLVASVSSCLAVVGSVVIAFSQTYKSKDRSMWGGAVKPNLMFHLGRLSTFLVLGGLLGWIGSEINISGSFLGTYTIIIALVMLWLGLSILGFVPTLAAIGIHLPKSLAYRWQSISNSGHWAAPFALGGLSFFLPCGFTQSMQIFALASGSAMVGGLSLFLFALGTLPALLIAGIASSWTKTKKFQVFEKAAGLLVIIFAIYTFQTGVFMKNLKGNVFAQEKTQKKQEQAQTKNPQSGNEQVVEMHVTRRGFEPNVLKIKAGVPVRWVIKGDQVTGCTNKIIVPDLGIERSLSSGDTIVQFTAPKAGKIPFSCWMGMVQGTFIVE